MKLAKFRTKHGIALHAGGASAASLGYAGLQAVRRNTRFARYCEGIALADAPIFTTTIIQAL